MEWKSFNKKKIGTFSHHCKLLPCLLTNLLFKISTEYSCKAFVLLSICSKRYSWACRVHKLLLLLPLLLLLFPGAGYSMLPEFSLFFPPTTFGSGPGSRAKGLGTQRRHFGLCLAAFSGFTCVGYRSITSKLARTCSPGFGIIPGCLN